MALVIVSTIKEVDLTEGGVLPLLIDLGSLRKLQKDEKSAREVKANLVSVVKRSNRR